MIADSGRVPMIAANWKMNLTVADAVTLVAAMRPRLEETVGVETVICPPFVSLDAIRQTVAGSSIQVGAQNSFWEERGAYTGEVSPIMLAPLCRYVIIGHSERRQYFGVTDDIVNRQIRALLLHQLIPILCVGETLADYESGNTGRLVERQVRAALADILTCPGLVIAYEPIWAIGTGRAATGEGANAVIGTIRAILSDLMGDPIARSTRILYGGSVTGANIREFVDQQNIDGGLVGGASLKPDDFVGIVRATAAAKQAPANQRKARKSMAAAGDLLWVFPPAPSVDAVEWPGDPIGRSNVVTRTKSRTKFHDKSIDQSPGRREHLVNAAIAHIVTNARREPTFLHDVIIHGIRVRAMTNSSHLIQFWRENWYSPEEWQEQTGSAVPEEPTVTVYALGGVAGEEEAAYYSRSTNTIIFFNTSYYGQLKSWVLGAVGRVLAAEFGIHSIHGACVERQGDGVLYIAPTGTGKSTSSYGLMKYPGTRFHSDDWVYLRYARHTHQGQLLVPIRITTHDGEEVRGFRCNPWISEHPNSRGTARCLDLTNREITVDVSEFDRSRPIEAHAYTSEKRFYLRSNLIENFPDAGEAILRSHLENVPIASASFVATNASGIDAIIAGVRSNAKSADRTGLASMSDASLRDIVASLFAFDNSRAMLDITDVFSASRVFTNPMEPVRLSTVFLLKRDPTDPVVLDVLTIDDFVGRLLIGETPDGKREIAYNAYRAVDDDDERAAIGTLRHVAESTGESLYQAYTRATALPETLIQEFTLFQELFSAALCYDCNTTLQHDPRVTTKKEAVRLTLEVILLGIKNRARDYCLTLDDYRSSIPNHSSGQLASAETTRL